MLPFSGLDLIIQAYDGAGRGGSPFSGELHSHTACLTAVAPLEPLPENKGCKLTAGPAPEPSREPCRWILHRLRRHHRSSAWHAPRQRRRRGRSPSFGAPSMPSTCSQYSAGLARSSAAYRAARTRSPSCTRLTPGGTPDGTAAGVVMGPCYRPFDAGRRAVLSIKKSGMHMYAVVSRKYVHSAMSDWVY